MKIRIRVIDIIEILKPVFKLMLIIWVGKSGLGYKFNFYNLVALYTIFKLEERINREDFYVTKVIKKEEMDDLL